MALIGTLVSKSRVQDRIGDRVIARGTLAFDNAYPTNGEALNLAQIGLTSVVSMNIAPTAGYVFEYVVSTGKVKAYWVPTGTNAAAAALGEVAANTDLSALTAVPFEAWSGAI